MRYLRYILRITLQKIMSVRVFNFTVIMLLISLGYNEPLRRFTAEMKYPSSPWVFPFMLTQFTYLIMFWFSIIYVNADIPFMQCSGMYGFLRIGKRKWGITQLCVLLLRSLTLVIITCFCSVITLLPRIKLTSDWGNLLKTIAMGQAYVDYDFQYNLYYEAMTKFTPLELMCLTIVITTLVVTFLAILMFLVSLYVDRVFAVSGASALTILLFFVLNIHHKTRYLLAKFIPTIWPQVARLYTPERGFYWFPSVRYMLIFLIAAISLLSIMVVRRVRYIEFNWQNEDA